MVAAACEEANEGGAAAPAGGAGSEDAEDVGSGDCVLSNLLLRIDGSSIVCR